MGEIEDKFEGFLKASSVTDSRDKGDDGATTATTRRKMLCYMKKLKI